MSVTQFSLISPGAKRKMRISVRPGHARTMAVWVERMGIGAAPVAAAMHANTSLIAIPVTHLLIIPVGRGPHLLSLPDGDRVPVLVRDINGAADRTAIGIGIVVSGIGVLMGGRRCCTRGGDWRDEGSRAEEMANHHPKSGHGQIAAERVGGAGFGCVVEDHGSDHHP
jgi:hypothetical protein